MNFSLVEFASIFPPEKDKMNVKNGGNYKNLWVADLKYF